MTSATNAPARPAGAVQDAALRLLVRFFRADWSGALLAIVILALAIEAATDGKPFLHPSNIMTILNNSAAIGIIAGGMTLVILTAGIDLSVGSVMGLCAALTGYVASYWAFPPLLAIMAGLGIGAGVGFLHGTLIARFGMPAFIVTLAGLSVWRGVAHLSTGAQATPELPAAFDVFGRMNPLEPLRHAYREGTLPGWLNGIGSFVDGNWTEYFRTFQMSLVFLIAFFVLLAVLVSHTIWGRYVYAIGSSEADARQAGINTVRYRVLTYVFCSVAAAFGALLFLGRAPYAKSDYGQNWELDAIAAVVIGGTSLFGGRGSILGTFMGVILLKLIANGLTLAQLDTFWQMIVTGMIILLAVGLDIVRQSRNPEAVRRLLAAVGTAMAVFTLLTPLSLWLRAAVALREHGAMERLQAAGADLAPPQLARILGSADIASLTAQAAANLWPMLACLAAMLLSLACLALPGGVAAILACAGFAAAAAVLAATGLAQAIPFLALGAVAVLLSLAVPRLFDRARALRHDDA